nr:MAG TPA_asm: hypothetical protein [Caudoviricetes sp.]
MPKTRNRALLGHPRRCVVRWSVGVRDGDGAASVASPCWWRRDGWMPHPISRKKKSGGSIQLPWCPPFYLSTYQTKSNPDMRNSKLAHTQAGF